MVVKKWNFFVVQYFLALIPFVGLFISIICVWSRIYKITHRKRYILLHYLIAIIPLIIMFILFCVLFFNLFVKSESPLRDVLILLTAYICYAVSALCSVYVGKWIIDRYNIKRVI